MNIKVLYAIAAGHVTYQEGELVTLPDADALACIKVGAAEPADRRARKIVDAANAAERAALELATVTAQLNNPDKRPRDGGGFVSAIQARAANLSTNAASGPGRFGGI